MDERGEIGVSVSRNVDERGEERSRASTTPAARPSCEYFAPLPLRVFARSRSRASVAQPRLQTVVVACAARARPARSPLAARRSDLGVAEEEVALVDRGLRSSSQRLSRSSDRVDLALAVQPRALPWRRMVRHCSSSYRPGAAARSGHRRRRPATMTWRGRRSERRTPSPGCARPAPSSREGFVEQPVAAPSVSTSKAGSMRASTGRSRSSSAQKPWMVLMWASSNSTARSSRAASVAAGAAASARTLELLAQPQLQLAGRFLAEGDGDDLGDAGAAGLNEQHDARRPTRWSFRCQPPPRR